MGLDTSHDCYHGSYSSFNTWRDKLAEVAGYEMETSENKSFPKIDWNEYTDDNLGGEWKAIPDDPLMILLLHFDCEGVISQQHTLPLAKRLAELLPLMPEGWMRERTQNFINGLFLAHERHEQVEFH